VTTPRWKASRASEIGLDGSAWDEAVLAFETGTMFHTTVWTEAVARGFHRQASYFAFLGPSGDLKALFPVTEGKRGPFRTAYSPVTIVTPYGGPACATEDLAPALRAIQALRRTAKWDYVRIALPPVPGPLPDEPGLTLLKSSTRIVPLGSDGSIWKGLNRRCKRYIKKAEEAGAVVRDVKDFGFLEDYLGWAESAFSRTGTEFETPRDLYDALRDFVLPTGTLLVRGAYVEDRPGVIEFFGLSKGWLYAIDSAMDRTMGVDGLGNLLTWDTMRIASKRGATRFDMLGTTIPHVAEYKQSFGGELAPVFGLEASTRAFRMAKRLAGAVGR